MIYTFAWRFIFTYSIQLLLPADDNIEEFSSGEYDDIDSAPCNFQRKRALKALSGVMRSEYFAMKDGVIYENFLIDSTMRKGEEMNGGPPPIPPRDRISEAPPLPPRKHEDSINLRTVVPPTMRTSQIFRNDK